METRIMHRLLAARKQKRDIFVVFVVKLRKYQAMPYTIKLALSWGRDFKYIRIKELCRFLEKY